MWEGGPVPRGGAAQRMPVQVVERHGGTARENGDSALGRLDRDGGNVPRPTAVQDSGSYAPVREVAAVAVVPALTGHLAVSTSAAFDVEWSCPRVHSTNGTLWQLPPRIGSEHRTFCSTSVMQETSDEVATIVTALL